MFQSPPLPLPKKVSPKESEIKHSPRQLMAFMTLIEICIWNHKIMQNQEAQTEMYRENCFGKQGTQQPSWKYFSFYMNWRQHFKRWQFPSGNRICSPASSTPFLIQHFFHANQNIMIMFNRHSKGKKTQQASIITDESIKWDNIWAPQQAILRTAANT